MAYKKTSIKLTAAGRHTLKELLASDKVLPYHKSILQAMSRRINRLSPADVTIFKLLQRKYFPELL